MSENMQSEGCSHQDIDKAIPSISESVVIHTEQQEADNLPLNNSAPPPNTRRPYICIAVFIALAVATAVALFVLKGSQKEEKAQYREGGVEFNSTLGLKYTWLQQKLDHSDPNSAVWWQRLFFKNHGSYFNASSPIFLYIPLF